MSPLHRHRDTKFAEFDFPVGDTDKHMIPTISSLHGHIVKCAERGTPALNPVAHLIFRCDCRLFFKYQHDKPFFNDTAVPRSWKAMLLTQPPVTAVNLYSSLSSRALRRLQRMNSGTRPHEPCSIEDMECSNEAGVTLGDVAAAVAMMRDAALPLLRDEGDGEEELTFAVESL